MNPIHVRATLAVLLASSTLVSSSWAQSSATKPERSRCRFVATESWTDKDGSRSQKLINVQFIVPNREEVQSIGRQDWAGIDHNGKAVSASAYATDNSAYMDAWVSGAFGNAAAYYNPKGGQPTGVPNAYIRGGGGNSESSVQVEFECGPLSSSLTLDPAKSASNGSSQ